MGKKYEKYLKAVDNHNQAKLNMMVAQGGSSQAGMAAAENKLLDAHIDQEEAWDKVMEDPTG